VAAETQVAGLMSIGRFARRTGLSVGALRHYAGLELLVPAYVEPATGYRYYHPSQLEPARLVAALRDLEVPLAVIRGLLDAPPAEQRRRLAAHHAAIEAEIWRLQRRAHRLRHIIEDEEDELVSAGPTIMLDPDDERRLAAMLFNRTWELLERTDRDAGDDDEMLHTAHASRYHWGRVGQPINLARGEWQCSRVYAVLGRAEPALHHARRALELAETHQAAPFDIGCGHEALARAYRVAGEPEKVAEHLGIATALAEKVDDAEEREILLGDLAQLR
jgi:DNA-binding transcriptional MerR regulator